METVVAEVPPKPDFAKSFHADQGLDGRSRAAVWRGEPDRGGQPESLPVGNGIEPTDATNGVDEWGQTLRV
jgi:hypothetical protein